jgi:hypothetical protein
MNRQQPYDSSMKGLFEEDAAGILPNLVEGVKLVEVLDIEALRPPLRADRVYRVQYKERPHILHLEFQSGADEEMAYRLAEHHTYLLRRYRQPVLSVVLYLFETTIVESPLQEMSGDEELLRFRFHVLPLWTFNARNYLEGHVLSMYPLLPAMANANKQALLQAVEEMIQFYQDDNESLARRLLWFSTLLNRSQTVLAEDKQAVKERLGMFDDLLEQSDFVQKQRELGREDGEMRASRRILVELVKKQYPSLATLAQQKAGNIHNATAIEEVIQMIFSVHDEEAARIILNAA